MIGLLKFLGKYLLLFSLGGLVVGRLFFPGTLEEMVITPAQQVPVFGQVLGVTWDKLGAVGPTLSQTSTVMTQQTVSVANQLEQSDLALDETVKSIVSSQDPKAATSQFVDKKVEAAVSSAKNLPAHLVQEIKNQIRREMYKEICQDWLASPTPQPSSPSF